MQVLDILNMALKDAQVLQKGESADADELVDALYKLNAMLALFSEDGLIVRGAIMGTFALTINKRTYTVAPSGADYAAVAPSKITDAYLVDSSSTAYPVDVIGRETYNLLSDRLITKGRPTMVMYDRGAAQQSVLTGTLSLYPMPDAAYTFYFGQQKALTGFTNYTDTVTFYPVYLEMLEYSLALRLWPQYHSADPPALLVGLAKIAKSTVERSNVPSMEARSGLVGAVGRSKYNILSDS